ncbi:C-X-C chemokine receptor type 3 [Alligator sinensis]|uniref:C-X-C chemokine receptor type 3 n=1 Tax=Alligator sinensis TaxID=38654 RepID=A0A3Q0FU28_ALLSI|nr:C-X-C chemokine receptor type 3 [Alligator sinensis]
MQSQPPASQSSRIVSSLRMGSAEFLATVMGSTNNWDLTKKLTLVESEFQDLLINDSDYMEYNGSNTCCFTPPCSHTHSFNQVLMPIFHSLVFMLGLPGNCLVMAVLLPCRGSLTSTDIFLLNLAVADVLLVLTLPFWAVQAVHGWVFSQGTCKLVGSIFNINFYASIFFLVCIGGDRYFSIVHAVHVYRHSRAHLMLLTCAVVWVACFLLTLPDFYYLSAWEDDRLNRTVCSKEFSIQHARKWRGWLDGCSQVLGFLLPLVAMLFCYTSIIITLRRSQGFHKHRAMRLILSVVGIFFLCWTPYHLVQLLETLIDQEVLSRDCAWEEGVDTALSVTSFFGYLHCCLNPLLYAFVGVKFRGKLLELLARTGCISRDLLRRKGSLPALRRDSMWSETTEASNSGL